MMLIWRTKCLHLKQAEIQQKIDNNELEFKIGLRCVKAVLERKMRQQLAEGWRGIRIGLQSLTKKVKISRELNRLEVIM